MAYPTRQREPLLDREMAQAIEKRSKELIGIALFGLGFLTMLMVWSYSPDDPNWMVSTDAPVSNWLGRTGASIAGMMVMVGGLVGWAIAAILMTWGVRFALHMGHERALGRLIFAVPALFVFSVYTATLVPSDVWAQAHKFGLGGMGGATALGVVLTALPLGSAFAVKLLSVVMAISLIVFGAFVLGFTKPEVQRLTRWLLLGLVSTYAAIMTVLGRSAQIGLRGASAGLQGAATLREQRAEKREAARIAAQEHAAWEATQAAQLQTSVPIAEGSPALSPEMMAPDFVAEPAPAKQSLLSRVPSLIKRPDAMPEPELVANGEIDHDVDAPEDNRVKERIADAIKARVRQNSAIRVESVAPLTRGRGHGPTPLILNDTPVGLPPEPPLTSAHVMPTEPPLMAQPVPAPIPQAPVSQIPTPPQAPAHDEIIEEMTLAQPVPVAPVIPTPQPRKVVQQPAAKPIQPSKQAKAEAQPMLAFEDKQRAAFDLPPLDLLTNPVAIERHHLSDDALEENARMLENVLDDYGVKGEIVSVRPGPVVTMYELEPAPGLKASRVIGLSDDIARSMMALSARVSTVPGRSVIGIELPNENREKVVLREILSARDFGDSNMKLPLALGKDIGGDAMVANLAKMPHLLIAGTTGSGKSVAINTMILSLLYKLTPEDCRLIMIDPKMLELSVYDGIPHLLSPVVTDPKKAVVALKWVVGEMEERYRKMSKMGVRNIDGYNGRVKEALDKGELFSRTVQTGFDDDTGEPVFETEEIMPVKLPYIVVIVDEMADLMMVAGKEIEACIQRLAQMARASGIHLIMATQRPSVDVITGTIKANFPTRISFQVTSKIDSRTILGEMGAEQLLGMGDMLYMAGGAKITRCHGPFVSDEEVEEIVNHLKAYGPPEYVGGVVEGPAEDSASNIDQVLGLGGNTDGEDALYDQAVGIVIRDRKCSTSYIQRKLAIGYNKAARLVEQMEDQGVVSSANHVGKREILVPEQ
ncbi:MAG: DNA translocase FtsK 4TM domain-containing protein [Aliishimia sp.]